MLSYTEENYLKAIYRLSESGLKAVLTNEIAERMSKKAAYVTERIKKLSSKNLLSYKKDYVAKITNTGKSQKVSVIRKNILWESFFIEKIHFNRDDVHDAAEQLEHIQLLLLIEKLD